MFRDTGYHDRFLEKERNKIREININTLLVDRNGRGEVDDMGTCIVLD